MINNAILYNYLNRAPANRTRWNLSSKISFHLLHSLRARHDGVLIGIKTLVADHPQLNVRDQLYGQEIQYAQTRPIIIDSNLKILRLNPKTLKIRRPIICCCLKPDEPLFLLAQTKLSEIGGSVISCSFNENKRYLQSLLLSSSFFLFKLMEI